MFLQTKKNVLGIVVIFVRYGTTSCAIASLQNNSGSLIVVEPDPRVWAIHEFNKLAHNCASYSVFGVLAKEDVEVIEFHNDLPINWESHGYQLSDLIEV